MARQKESHNRKKEAQDMRPPELVSHTIPKSERLARLHPNQPLRSFDVEEFSFEPDLSATAGVEVTGVSLVFTESHQLQVDEHKRQIAQELWEQEKEECTFHPDFGSMTKLRELAGRAEERERARLKASPKVAKEKDAAPVDEERKLRRQRRKAEAKRQKGLLKLPFKRETYTPIDLLIRSKGRI
jgi:hypothetical protein